MKHCMRGLEIPRENLALPGSVKGIPRLLRSHRALPRPEVLVRHLLRRAHPLAPTVSGIPFFFIFRKAKTEFSKWPKNSKQPKNPKYLKKTSKKFRAFGAKKRQCLRMFDTLSPATSASSFYLLFKVCPPQARKI